MHDDFALSRFCHVNHSLDDIVGVLVLHHGVQGAVGPVLLAAHFIYQQSSLRTRRVDHTLLHNITEGEKKEKTFRFIICAERVTQLSVMVDALIVGKA